MTGLELRHRLRPRGTMAAPIAAAAVLLAAPALASADVTSVSVEGSVLQVRGLPGSPSAAEVRLRTVVEAGPIAAGERYEITDEGGMRAAAPACVALSPTLASCDATGVTTLRATLGEGDDVLVLDGSASDGVPAGLNTRLDGGRGADVLRGGSGDDRVRGGPGRDTVAGWSGADNLQGGPGADGLIGFGGDDRLFGGSGRDALFGQKGRDAMSGGPGNDVILARDGLRDLRITCGKGARQTATTDARDPEATNCSTPADRKRREQARRSGAKAVAAAASALRSLAGPQGE